MSRHTTLLEQRVRLQGHSFRRGLDKLLCDIDGFHEAPGLIRGGKTSGRYSDRRREAEGGCRQQMASLVWERVVGILTKLLQRTVRGPAPPSPAVPDLAQEIAT
jgi:hypothetical protein